MRGAELVPGPLRHAHDQRHPYVATEHVTDVRRAVDYLVERKQCEVDRHQLDDWPQPGHRRAHAEAHDRVLGDRGVAHAPLTELLEQPRGHFERAAEHADVLAHQDHALIARELLAQGRVECVAIAHLWHQRSAFWVGRITTSPR